MLDSFLRQNLISVDVDAPYIPVSGLVVDYHEWFQVHFCQCDNTLTSSKLLGQKMWVPRWALLGAVLELQGIQPCQSITYTSKMRQIG